MSILNVGEIWYSVARQTSKNEADQAIGELQELGIDFVDADWKMTRMAAACKSKKNVLWL